MSAFQIPGLSLKYIFKNKPNSPHKKVEISAGYFAFTTDYDKIIHSGELILSDNRSILNIIQDRFLNDLIVYKNFDRIIESIRRDLFGEINKFDLRKLDERQNCALVLLVDHSGSMRGVNILNAAVFCAALAPVLIKFSIKVEILGFTTSSWRGGRSKDFWSICGKPRDPGRLCDLLHVVHRGAEAAESWNDDAVRGMFAPDLLKENVDGEALLWAESRLLAIEAKARHLVVLSDGAPVDDSTLYVNPPDFLHKHLIDVSRRIKADGKIKLNAVGLQHDVSVYYDSDLCIATADDIVPAVLSILKSVLEAPQAHDDAYGGKHEA